MALITTNTIAGGAVWGVEQVDYSVWTDNGTKLLTGQDYLKATLTAACQEAAAIETETAAFMDVVRARERKISEIGDALSVIAKAIASMKVKKQKSSDESDEDDALITASANLAKYGVSLPLTDGNKVKRGDALKAQSDAQYALDTEDNDLQQDLVTLQGLVSKRDSAYSMAAKITKKITGTGKEIISNIGA